MEKDESKKDIDDETKEVEINKNGDFAETEHDKLFVDDATKAPPPLKAMTNTTVYNI